MSTSISGRGKPRKHGQDLSGNAMSMGGGQHVAMPPNNGAVFATPTVPLHNDYRPTGGYVQPQFMQHQLAGSGGPSMVLPDGVRMQQEQPSHLANMQGLPQNMNNTGHQINPNMQWNGVPQQPQQQHMQQQHGGMAPSHMGNRMPVAAARGYPTQQVPAQMAYGFAAPQGYFMQQPGMYPQQYTPEQAAYAQQQAYMAQQQYYQQQPQQQYQQQQAGGAAPMTMQAPPALQQQQQQQGGGAAAGGPMGGAPAGQPQQNQPQQQQPQGQPMHGGVPPASATQQPAWGGNAAPVAPTGPTPNATYSAAQQQQQPRPAVQPPPKRKILAIVNPETHETVNKKELEEEIKKEEEVAPKADKEEAKGTDETDSAAPEVKKQFAAQIMEQTTTKSDQPAPAPTLAPAVKEKKVLFSLDQLKDIGLTDKVAHIAAPPVPVVAAPAAEQPRASEYLPAPLAAPAYPNNYKEKQASPDLALPEMTASNNDEHPDDSHLTAEVPATPTADEPASSSSDKNTSNDSAICVQTPVTPPPKEEKGDAVDVEEEKTVVDESTVEEVREKEEEEGADKQEEEPFIMVEEPLSKKLEQLVIAEAASQEEAESEPSTPAPVTPSVSETAATLAEEEEDAEKAAAALEEEKQRKRAELEAEIAKNEQDPEQVDVSRNFYNREYLYNVRDIEKLCAITPCPLSASALLNFGICRSLASNEPKRKQDGQGGFMPGWARSGGGGGGRGGGGDRKPYQGRQSERDHRGGGGGGRQGSNKKLPPSIRPSIERRVDTNVQLHKAEKAWKPEKVAETDLESDEVKKKLLLKTIRALFNKITPTTKDKLIDEFLDHKVYQSPCLNDVISIIFDKAVEEPKFCPLYSSMCHTQVQEELKLNNNVSLFRNAILVRAQDTFTTKNLDEFTKEKQAEIEAETDEKKKKEKQIELLEAQSKFRRRKFGNITFIGQLYLQQLISVRIILFCVVDLLKSVTEKPENLEGYEADEESVDCAVRLLETIGKRLHEESVRTTNDQKKAAEAAKPGAKGPAGKQPVQQPQRQPAAAPFPLDMTFQTLEGAIPIVTSRIKFMIMNLVELRKNGWVPRKTADAGPKKLDEIKKDMQKEQMENQNAQLAYERKHSRQQDHMGGGRPMGGGGGGHGGPNPKRMVIQRNSQDNRGTKDDRLSQAHKSATLASNRALPKKNASLSSVTDGGSLGGKAKNKWSGGASGGSENSKKEDRAAAIQSARFIGGGQRSSSSASMKGAEDDGASASGTATQVNSEDEREQNEAREKQEKEVTSRLVMDVTDFHGGDLKLDEVRDEVFKVEGAEKYSKPSLATVFKCLIAAAVKKGPVEGMLSAFGHVLSYCLLKKAEEKDNKGREEMLKGIAEACRNIVEQEQWEDVPKVWDFVAEVLINAHLPSEGLFEGAHPSLADFKDAFLNAAKDSRKPYTLFILVLKRLAEMHYKRDKDGCIEVMSWVLEEECNKSITKQMDTEKLNKAMMDTKMEIADKDNLYAVMRHE